jgi:hypothetical protein
MIHRKRTVSLSNLVFLAITSLVLQVSGAAPQQKPVSCSSLSDKDSMKKAKEAQLKNNLADAESYYKCALAKKKNPEYEKALQAVREKIANQRASEAEASLKADDLKSCDERLQALKTNYPETGEVTRVETAYKERVTNIQNQFNAAKKTMDNDPDSALKVFEGLKKYSYILDGLDSSLKQASERRVEIRLLEAEKLVEEKQFQGASLAYQNVLAQFDAKNQRAQDGLNQANAGQKAYISLSEASSLLADKQYEKAMLAIADALRVYPGGRSDFERLRSNITADWLKYLVDSVGPNPEAEVSFNKALETYLRLLQIKALDPSHDALKKIQEMRTNLAVASAKKAKTGYWEDWDKAPSAPERIATAYLLMLNARLSGAEDMAREEDLKALADLFYRKRSTRLILSVENSAGADADYVQRLETRCRNIVDDLHIQDLTLYTRNDYERKKAPETKLSQPEVYEAAFDESMIVQPNGKSAYVLLKIVIDQYIKKEKEAVKSTEVESSYIAETPKKKENPEYLALNGKVTGADQFFHDPKNRNKPYMDWKYEDYIAAAAKLKIMKSEIDVDDVRTYKYQKITWHQNSAIRLSVKVIDNWSKAEEPLPGDIEERYPRIGEETINVKDRDTNNAFNNPLRWPTAADDLLELQSRIDADLNAKVPELLKPYLDRFYYSAKKALEESRKDDAAEDFLTHWAFYRGKVDPELSKQIVKTVLEATGFNLAQNGSELIRRLTSARPVAR